MICLLFFKSKCGGSCPGDASYCKADQLVLVLVAAVQRQRSECLAQNWTWPDKSHQKEAYGKRLKSLLCVDRITTFK